MTSEEFRNLNRQEASAYSLLLQALWQDVHSDWQSAHELAQDIETPDGAWVHAYLHRKEGDEFNATYWYRRADRPVSTATLEDEWGSIVTELLQKQPAILSGGVG
ncbi:hypothetical protein [Terriglobus saanensis]|uniref:Uncharacterized protein n=1 Tax=Terriglobus saanensis (strain ATCC BAA-1853 / DSM 23119 / SP1PR4) TaxID=401053 RepID=E8V8B9_TERSS|nr:hypothetical protein [Terriglobus saanensis]ADV81822.1 hypothetical protein AciPR4_0989 [Terriglobus saanensis SP1PR4]